MGKSAGPREDVSVGWLMTDMVESLAAAMDARGINEHHLQRTLAAIAAPDLTTSNG